MNRFNPVGLEYRVETWVELAIIIMDEMGERPPLAFQFLHHLPGLLGHPALGGMGCCTHHVYPPRADFDEEQDVQRL
jgi:hypothetical protein